jgi:hypothetical protein
VQEIELKAVIARLSSFLLSVIRSAQSGAELNSGWTPAPEWQPISATTRLMAKKGRNRPPQFSFDERAGSKRV